MAQSMRYTPQVHPTLGPEEDLERLLHTLHERGALRVANAVADRFPEALDVFMRQLDTPKGRRATALLAVLGQVLGDLDARTVQRFVDAVRTGLEQAGERVGGDPPTIFALLGRSNDEDVRRGLWAALTFLGALGGALDAGDGGDGASA